MPLPVKNVWRWYLTLACASCVPLVFYLAKVFSLGRAELFQLTDKDRKFELTQLPGADELRIGKKAVVIVPAGKVWTKGMGGTR